MKYLLTLAIAGCISATTIAQENANEKAIAHEKTLGYSGGFTYKPDTKHNVSVGYSFTPLEPTTEVNYMWHTATPRPVSFKIFNSSGVMVKEVPADEKILRHKGTLDVSDLPAGKYEYRIYWDTNVAHTIRFNKK